MVYIIRFILPDWLYPYIYIKKNHRPANSHMVILGTPEFSVPSFMEYVEEGTISPETKTQMNSNVSGLLLESKGTGR